MDLRGGRPRVASFGPFVFNFGTGELHKDGVRRRLEGQPLQILTVLVDRAGEPVSRDELREALWPAETYVDFEHNLNSAVKRLRAALGDSGHAPIYVERLPKRGYRLMVVPVTHTPAVAMPASAMTTTIAPVVAPVVQDAAPARTTRRWLRAVGWLIATIAVAGGTAFAILNRSTPPAPSAVGSLVILPFTVERTQSSDATLAYVAFGLTDEVTTELSRLGRVRVISGSTALWYGDAGRSLPDIAKELNVDAVLAGEVTAEGSSLSISVELIDGTRGTRLWAQSYKRERQGLLGLQLEISRAVAREIRLTLTPQQQTHLTTRRAADPAVQAAYLEGKYFLSRGTEVDWAHARESFQRAIALDPGHALSYAGLADVFVLTDAIPASYALPQARAYALRALSLDDSLPGTYATLGFIAYYGDWDWAAAERALRRSLDLDPGSVRSMRWYARVIGAVGRRDEALSYVRRAAQLDPASIATLDSAAAEEFRGRQYDRGLAVANRILAIDRNDSRGYEHLATNSAMLGRFDDCIAAAARGLQIVGRASHFVAISAYCHGRAGHAPQAAQLVRELTARAHRDYVPEYFRTIAAIGLGHIAEAIDLVERGYAQHDPYMVELKTSPWLDAIRDDPRMERLVKAMRFPG